MRWAEIVQKQGVGELLVTSVDREGTEKGFDYELYTKLSRYVDLPLIANGGCGKMEDIEKISKNWCIDGVALSSSIHFDKLKILELKNYFKNKHLDIRY